MDKFFSKLTSKASIKTIHVQDYLRKNNSRGLIYIPSASYDKMGIWVLPTDDRRRIESLLDYAKNGKASYSREINRFTKGSFWRNFLSKYPEVNIMHKRTLLSYSAFTRSKQYVSEEDLINASNEIISAQSNDPYWHGMFGGAYYRFMRHSVFKHAIKGEQLALRKAGIDDSGIEAKDILMNGRNELIVSNNYFKAFFSAFEGGTMFEIDDLLSYYNWSNVFTRKEEAYHKDNFPVDRWIRRSFRDHFLIDTGFKNISNDRFEELGSFVDGNYSYKINENTLTLSFEGTIKLENNKFNAMITKTISMDANKLIVEYDIIGDKLDKDIFFSPELNFTLNSHPYMTSCVLSNENELEDIKYIDHGFELRVDQIKFIDNHERTMLKLSLPGTEKTVSYPVITFSYTNEGNEEQFQASCVMPIYRYNGKLSFSITVELESF
ncbi:MAG: DUF1926 domain-containing protein [Candidatus Heimdallarchaeota archaeon]|nr:DUF1926 domain-containing protein [Candidatus Heimdallarchaeota archaeon]